MTSVIKTINPQTNKPEYRSVGLPMKAADGNTVSGYAVRFTDANDPDLHGEYFTAKTNFWLQEHNPIGKPILLDHAFDEKFKSIPVGIIDLVREDEIGLWLEGKLKERAEYEDMLRGWKERKYIDLDDTSIRVLASNMEKAVKAFFSTGKAQWSTGALPQSVEVADDGHINSWALIESTGVMTPAEPDGTEIQLKQAFKQLDDILKRVSTATATKEPIQGVKESNADNAIPIDKKENKQEDTMDENMIRQIIRMVLEESKNMSDGEAVVEEDDLVEAVVSDFPDDDTKSDGEKMDEEEMAKAVAEKAWQIIEAKQATRQKALDAVANVNRQKALTAPVDESTILPATQKSNSQGNVPALQIRDITPYDNWSPADFSFAVDIARQSERMSNPIMKNTGFITKAFMNQFADKAIKAHKAGNITLNNRAVKAINAIKADELDYSTQAGFGDEWVPTGWRDQIWDTPRLDLVYTQIQVEEMPNDPYDVFTEGTDPTVFFVPETTDEDQLGRNDSNAAIPDTKIGTSKVRLTSKKHALRVNWSAELQEDAIAAAIPKFRNQSQRVVENAQELSVLLGDTATSGNINYDGGTPTATDSYLAYDGLFKQALVTATSNAVDAGGAAPTLAQIRSLRSKLGNAQGFNPANLAIFTDFQTYMQLLSIDAVVTVDKIGQQATIKTGSLGQIDGINVFVSGQMNLAAADGKITYNAAGTLGRLMMVYLPDWYRGYRRRIASHINYLPFADAWEMVLTVRTALAARSYSSAGAQQSTDDSVSVLYNIGV